MLSLIAVASACRIGGPRDPRDPRPPTAAAGSLRIGDRCVADAECASTLCIDVAGDGLVAYCSDDCARGCPANMGCAPFERGRSLCVFATAPAAAEMGTPCQNDNACQSGLCVAVEGDPRGSYCTRSCALHACPVGYPCTEFSDGRKICALPPVGGGAQVGQSCQHGGECGSLLCIDVQGDDRNGFCSADCRIASDCPTGMACLAFEDRATRCGYPVGAGGGAPVGSSCGSDLECASGACIDLQSDSGGPFCTGSCRGSIDCPDGMACAELEALGPSCIY